MHVRNSSARSILAATLLVSTAVLTAQAQERRAAPGTPLPDYAQIYAVPQSDQPVALARNALPNIMLTGYWPPTNEMIRRFSSNATQNPAGWVGENWENRGYNIYAFFPEFPGGTLNQGVGDFEVDYQDTLDDFWRITDQVQPIALITFGRASANWDWEVEERHRNRSVWDADYVEPFYPDPNPPDHTVMNGARRYSSLPMQAIVDAVNSAGIGLNAFIDSNYGGQFLCEYIGYHACWYHSLHADASDPNNPTWNVASGHIHLGSAMSLTVAMAGTDITLRELTAYLDAQTLHPGDMDGDGAIGTSDVNLFVLALINPEQYHTLYPKYIWRNADCNADGEVTFADINPFVVLLTGQ